MSTYELIYYLFNQYILIKLIVESVIFQDVHVITQRYLYIDQFYYTI